MDTERALVSIIGDLSLFLGFSDAHVIEPRMAQKEGEFLAAAQRAPGGR